MKEGRKAFFSEEKKQKTFISLAYAPRAADAAKDQKFFGSFFQKRTASFLILAFSITPATAQEVFRQPGTPPPAPPATDSIPTGIVPADPDLAYTQIPVPDRNRIIDALGTPDNPFNPYHQSTLKGDRPIFGDYFIELSAVLDTVYEPRAVPVPVNIVDTYNPQGNDQFGRPKQTFFSETLIPSFAIIKGDTSFKPPDFEFRLTPAFNYTQLDVGELGIVDIDPTRGTTRNTTFVGLQEAFVDVHLQDVSARYDFDAIRIGIQPINADFRGFLFQDQQLGVRLFGDRFNNRIQYNLAYFRRIDKDTNSGLNDLGQPLRRDDIFMANLFIQDSLAKGYTTELSIIQNDNHETAFDYDKNGFQVRPAAIGLDNPHKYDVTYVGLNGDGHIGRLNLTQSAYYALGNDKENEFSGVGARIRAYFAALEPSVDFDWLRIRGSFLYASGDGNPYGRTEGGFDAILENPQFAGADTSYWIRQGIPLIGGGGVDLVGPNGVLPDLRSSKDEGQSNFINPGVLLLGIGADADVLPELRFSLNFNHLSFNNTSVLEVLRQQTPIHRDIGWDMSGAATWRPFDTQNIIFRASAAILIPGQGFTDLFASEGSDQVYYSVLLNVILKY